MGESRKDYMDLYEVAEQLGVSMATVWNLIKQHEVIRYKLPGERRTMVRVEDVERMRQPVPRPGRRKPDPKVEAAA
jgi:predicted DNA-binding transcriptional regulator AlpA